MEFLSRNLCRLFIHFRPWSRVVYDVSPDQSSTPEASKQKSKTYLKTPQKRGKFVVVLGSSSSTPIRPSVVPDPDPILRVTLGFFPVEGPKDEGPPRQTY